MSTSADIEKKFWKALKSDRTVMLGVAGAENSHTRPMTAQLVGDEGPLCFFGSKESGLADKLVAGIKMLLGIDPRESFKGKVAKVDLS